MPTPSKFWYLMAGLVVALVLTALCIGQAVTFAWLSSFPAQAQRLDLLTTRVWMYGLTSAVLLVIDVVLALGIVRSFRRRRAGQSA